VSGRQALVSLGLRAKRNKTGIFQGVTGKVLRLALPAYGYEQEGTVKQRLSGKRRLLVTDFRYAYDQKNVENPVSETVFSGFLMGTCPSQTHASKPAAPRTGSCLYSPLNAGSSAGSSPRETGEPSLAALFPSCLSGSTDVLHVANKKVLQHFGVTCHSVDHAVPCRP